MQADCENTFITTAYRSDRRISNLPPESSERPTLERYKVSCSIFTERSYLIMHNMKFLFRKQFFNRKDRVIVISFPLAHAY